MAYFAQHVAYIFPSGPLARIFPPTVLLIIQSLAISTAVPLADNRGPGNLRISALFLLMLSFIPQYNLNSQGSTHVFALQHYLLTLKGRKNVGGLRLVNSDDLTFRPRLVAALGAVSFEDKSGTVNGLFVLINGILRPADQVRRIPHFIFLRTELAFRSFIGMLSDPVSVFGDLFARESFEKVLLLVAPVLFLPLVRMRYLIPVFPLLALYLVAEGGVDELSNPQQDVALLPFVFIGAVYALTRVGVLGVKRILVDKRVLAVLALTAVVLFIRCIVAV